MVRSQQNLIGLAALFALVLSTPMLAIGCGASGDDGGSDDAGFQQVTDVTTTFDTTHLDTIGFKKARSYDVETLPGATDAIFGFWRISTGDPIDFEVRFYATHGDAVEMGTALADEGSGTDAVLDDTKAKYKEGVRDRRMIVGKGPGGGGRSGIGPRYGDYAIYGNVVMLCGGAEIVQALERCEELALALEGAASP